MKASFAPQVRLGHVSKRILLISAALVVAIGIGQSAHSFGRQQGAQTDCTTFERIFPNAEVKTASTSRDPYDIVLTLTTIGTRYDNQFKRTVLQLLRFCISDLNSSTVSYAGDLGAQLNRTFAYSQHGEVGFNGESRACHLHILSSDEATLAVMDLFHSFVEHDLLYPLGDSPAEVAALGCTDKSEIWAEELSDIHQSSVRTCHFANGLRISFHPADALVQHTSLDKIVEVTNCDSLKCRTWLSRLLLAYYLPLSVARVLLIDLDVLILGDLAELFRHFSYMPKEALIGIAYEFQPIDTAWMQPSFARFKLGYGPHIGFPTFNGGVALYDLTKMRASKEYSQLIFNTTHLWRMRKEFTDTNAPMPWGDQDLLTMIYFDQPALFYIIPCGWNYQLCTAGFKRAYGDHEPFDYWCQDQPQIYHANGGSSFPAYNNGILVVIREDGLLEFVDAPERG